MRGQYVVNKCQLTASDIEVNRLAVSTHTTHYSLATLMPLIIGLVGHLPMSPLQAVDTDIPSEVYQLCGA